MKHLENIRLIKETNGIRRILLNDPRSYNALSLKTLNSLIKIFNDLNKDTKCKVIIIEGMGKGFSAGHDLKEIQSLKKQSSYKKLFNQCSKLMLAIVYHKKPIIANFLHHLPSIPPQYIFEERERQLTQELYPQEKQPSFHSTSLSGTL